jgi:predicted dehydrogenase
VDAIGDFNHVISLGRVDLESKYGGVFFYGVHMVEQILFWFGEDVRQVRVSKNGKKATASLVYDDGKLITLLFSTLAHGWETFVETEEGMIKLNTTVERGDPGKNYVDMVEMFRTGKEPRSHQSILASIAVLEALELSVTSGDWEKVPSVE